MRVWLVNQYAVPPSVPGGTRHYTLAREMIRRGHHVTVLASSFHHGILREMRLGAGEAWTHEVVGGVPFVWVRTLPYRGNTAARLLGMLMFAARIWAGRATRSLERPDVIVGSSPHLFAALAAQRLARRYGVPFFLEVRDLWPDTLVELGRLSRWHPLVLVMAWIERYLYRHADKVISLLPGASAHVVRKGGRSADVIWIPNGVDLSMVPPPAPPLENGAFTVMYAGAHGAANGLDAVLDAAALLQREGSDPRLRIVLIGDGPEKPRLQARARDEKLQNVEFQDPVPKDEVYALLQRAHAFVMVLVDSAVFGFGISPNKLFDYLVSARPVIFSVNSPSNPVAEVGAGMTTPAQDAPALAGAIRQLLAMSPGERWQMGLRGRAYVEQHHSLLKLVARLEESCGEAVARFDSVGRHGKLRSVTTS